MAGEAPPSDVLCEAMEYLTKLGTNLRSRSESLKDKRISKDKLRNSQAVLKAARKVLLICQLSKKSLENVETGVNAILKRLEEHNMVKKVSKHDLQIPKNVNLKHFKSVGVKTESLPMTKLAKYPVYYNCKLLRLRQKIFKRTSEISKTKPKKATPKTESGNESSEENIKGSKNGKSQHEKPDTDVSDPTIVDNPSKRSLDYAHNYVSENQSLGKESKKGDSKEISTKTSKNEDTIKKSTERKSSTCFSIEENIENASDIINSIDKSNQIQKESDEKPNSDEDSSKKSKEPDMGKKGDKTANREKSDFKGKIKEKHTKKPESDKNNESDEFESNKNHKKSSHKRFKKVRILDDSSSSEKEDLKESSIIDLVEDSPKKKSNTEPLRGFTHDESAEAKVEHKTDVQEQVTKNSNENKDDDCQSATKPMIKCVSLSKLLKPEVTTNKTDIILIDSPNKHVIVHLNNKGQIQAKLGKTYSKENSKKQITLQHQKERESQEIDKLKKQQVKSFVPKKFDINVYRLPKITEDFLQKHSLKLVTQNGEVICKTKDQKCEPAAAEQAKSALLNDSDGDKSDEIPMASKDFQKDKTSPKESHNQNVEAVTINKENTKSPDDDDAKLALLYVSDSENSDVVNNSESNKSPIEDNVEKDNGNNKEDSNEMISNTELPGTVIPFGEDNDEMISNKELPGTDIPIEDQDKELAKSSLLNDSSGSNSKSPSKSKVSNSVFKSRRKSIMESMHAKKMLLTYSSSSDTEDEKLKKAMKSMKENLLKGIDSDQEEFKEGLRKKLRSSSNSDEDIKQRVKKKRKLSKRSSKDKGNTSQDRSDSDKPDKESNSSSSKMGRSRQKPGGSSSQNSDTQDDKDIEGLANLKTLTQSRRRRDCDSEKSPKSGQQKENKMATKKKPLISGEGLLEAPSDSSNNDSEEEIEAVEEDLPPISLSELNGSGAVHLAKDDLLGDSESDSSKDLNSDAKNEGGSDSDIKTKRRKGNAIDSDSEAGSSRKKDGGVKMSDFEDSEDENSEPGKKAKRKKKSNDSDASGGGGSSSDEGSKKKRRRIKQIDSDVSGSDTENEGKSKHGRKNIRKVMGKNQLEEATKKAAREEKERVARIAERQKMYNNLQFDESGKPDEVILDKVVLDFDPETKEPLIEVDRGLVKKLKPHQANGIKFMWDACFESVKRIKKDRGSGCILAHCMGLGKTLQVVSLTHTLLIHDDLTTVKRVLVVCPLSTVLNWVNEFRMWLKHAESDFEVDVYELSRFKQNSERAFQLSQWFQQGGVCVLGYEMFRNLSADNPKKFKKKMLRQFQESLVDPGPNLVVCDEGHLLKNEKTSLSQSMNRVKTRRRIVLTGTPLQNNLKEYYCMVQFVKPNLLGKYNEYLNRFVNPITNGQYTDSTEQDIRVMKRRSHVLHKMLDGAVQRRDYGVLAPFLPPKHEYVLFITLTEIQTKLYQHYLDNYSRRPLAGKSSGFLFPDFQSLQRIWTHPLVLKYNSERYEIMQQKKRDREEEEDSEGSLVDFIDDDSTPDDSTSEESSDDSSDMSDDSRKKSKKKKSQKKSKSKENKASARRATRANPVEMAEDEQDPDIVEVKNENPTEWWVPLVTDAELDDMRNSNKLVLLFEILRQCEAIGDKLLVFSQSLYSLDLIEHFLGKVDEATQEGRIDEKLLGHVGSWSPGIDYFRLDGSTSCENRSIWCKNFNREDNPRARLFLISTRAGGLGINLVAANRVVIFDVSWNPSHDVQSIFRVYRFGQKKPCYVYRFLAMGTMEEKIYERQVTKQAISKRVIDEQQIDRHYAENDLAELYKFEPRPPAPRPVPLVPKDRFFAEMLKEHEDLIYKFHEHDSLLENKEEETLSEEERKAAWDDFENEKNRPPPAPFPNWPGMQNGMMNNLLAQQQQQLAYAALAQMLRKDMPNLSDDNIRNMLPIIYGSNPGMFGGYDYGLMQKLSEMYKYTQPGMMNPGMMNPMMNAGGATAGMGGGGTSGLQYEPPWQRQQQQQHMRLQQLLQQQQNQMGAKLYAGGLGSRDPVAMALQQQRAREIMMGGGGGGGGGGGAGGGGGGGGAAGGRPRGRPPLQPRAPLPSTAAADVVDLDSD